MEKIAPLLGDITVLFAAGAPHNSNNGRNVYKVQHSSTLIVDFLFEDK